MSSDLTFITNESGKSLRDQFGDRLRCDTHFFDCLVGDFFISGFYKLSPALQNTEKNCILIGIKTDRHVANLMQQANVQVHAKLYVMTFKDALDALAEKNKTIHKEFDDRKINTDDFAKKLMGQIVFLYFLQKKGWLGVAKGKEWGDGTQHFLRSLFDKKFGEYKIFFNDILEHLFYDTLATDRGHEALYRFRSQRNRN